MPEACASASVSVSVEALTCERHLGHSLDYYCFTDNMLICDSCMTESTYGSEFSSGHASHNISSKTKII